MRVTTILFASLFVTAACNDSAGPDRGFSLSGRWLGRITESGYPSDLRLQLELVPGDTGFVGVAQWTGSGTLPPDEVVSAQYSPPNTVWLLFGEGIPCNLYGGSRGWPLPDSTSMTQFTVILAPGFNCRRPAGFYFERQ